MDFIIEGSYTSRSGLFLSHDWPFDLISDPCHVEGKLSEVTLKGPCQAPRARQIWAESGGEMPRGSGMGLTRRSEHLAWKILHMFCKGIVGGYMWVTEVNWCSIHVCIYIYMYIYIYTYRYIIFKPGNCSIKTSSSRISRPCLMTRVHRRRIGKLSQNAAWMFGIRFRRTFSAGFKHFVYLVWAFLLILKPTVGDDFSTQPFGISWDFRSHSDKSSTDHPVVTGSSWDPPGIQAKLRTMAFRIYGQAGPYWRPMDA